MGIILTIAAFVAIVLLGYLFYVLFRGENI
ncbi:MAG: potassium-transporting ATPase subunit F [Clostridium sp.]